MQTFAAIKENIHPRFAGHGVFDLIGAEMALVEKEFRRQASSNIQVVNFLGEYIAASGGKRVRPALSILSAYAVGGDGSRESAIRLAVVMEMLHTATLVHDDIIDNAELRRNRPSVNAKFGNQNAVLMGDWLYMSAFETSLQERSLDVLDILTRLTRKMTEGELIQLTKLGNAEISEEDYFDILKRKTAYLFSGCCEIGAIMGNGTAEEKAALRDYGLNLGIAFQLADDLLDFTSNETSLGKAAGADLLEGKVTLPLILLLRKDPSFKTLLKETMSTGKYPERLRSEIREGFKSHQILEEVRQTAFSYARAARKNLDILPETQYSLALGELPKFVIERSS